MPLPLRSLIISCVLALSWPLAAVAAEPPATMGMNEIRTGMKGVGRTVWQGGKIETFQFEVMGLQKNFAPGRSLILVRASGGPLANTGILAGMSGSPCYIDGRLIGALSIGFAFENMGGAWRERVLLVADDPDVGGNFPAGSDALVASIGSGAPAWCW